MPNFLYGVVATVSEQRATTLEDVLWTAFFTVILGVLIWTTRSMQREKCNQPKGCRKFW